MLRNVRNLELINCKFGQESTSNWFEQSQIYKTKMYNDDVSVQDRDRYYSKVYSKEKIRKFPVLVRSNENKKEVELTDQDLIQMRLKEPVHKSQLRKLHIEKFQMDLLEDEDGEKFIKIFIEIFMALLGPHYAHGIPKCDILLDCLVQESQVARIYQAFSGFENLAVSVRQNHGVMGGTRIKFQKQSETLS